MNIKVIAIKKLNPAEYNPRIDLQPGDPEYDALKLSIEKFGLVEPIVWNSKTGNVVGGHQRLKVLIEKGITETECVVVDLDENQEKALNLALNKISGDWNDELLKEVLAELQAQDFDMLLTGFDENEIDRILQESIQEITAGGEIDTEEYADDEFECECPRCGFRFNS